MRRECRRVRGRESHEKRGRADDSPETIRKRLEVYAEETVPVIEYYEQRYRKRVVRNLHRRARSMGLTLIEAAAPGGVS